VVLFFVAEYIVLPELANASSNFTLLGRVSIPWLVVGFLLELSALVAYAELTHTVLSPGSPSRFQLFRVNMSSLAVSHVAPGGTAPVGAPRDVFGAKETLWFPAQNGLFCPG
jgi:uncharacterized membrane protein YbhN (UPF0104 family)